MLEDKLEQDLKQALLAGNAEKVSTLRGLKSVLLYAKVAEGKKHEGSLPDEKVISIFGKEAKKRQESADLYTQGGNQAKAEAELREKAIIEQYLPAAMSEEDISRLIDEAVKDVGSEDKAAMGRIIGAVKQKSKGAADGALVAKLVKERLGL